MFIDHIKAASSSRLLHFISLFSLQLIPALLPSVWTTSNSVLFTIRVRRRLEEIRTRNGNMRENTLAVSSDEASRETINNWSYLSNFTHFTSFDVAVLRLWIIRLEIFKVAAPTASWGARSVRRKLWKFEIELSAREEEMRLCCCLCLEVVLGYTYFDIPYPISITLSRRWWHKVDEWNNRENKYYHAKVNIFGRLETSSFTYFFATTT